MVRDKDRDVIEDSRAIDKKIEEALNEIENIHREGSNGVGARHETM